MQFKFENVKGYATYENAVKRGIELVEKNRSLDFNWVVIALPNGRFAPLVMCGKIPGGPGNFIGEANVCVTN